MLAKGVPENKVTYIPYGTDVDMFNPSIDGSSIRKELGLKDKFVVLYAGALGQANDLDTLLRAAERLKKNQICIIWRWQRASPIEDLRRKAKICTTSSSRARVPKDMPFIVASADACLAILQKHPCLPHHLSQQSFRLHGSRPCQHHRH